MTVSEKTWEERTEGTEGEEEEETIEGEGEKRDDRGKKGEWERVGERIEERDGWSKVGQIFVGLENDFCAISPVLKGYAGKLNVLEYWYPC